MLLISNYGKTEGATHEGIFFLLIRNTDVGRCIEVRDTFMSIICMDFCGMEVDSISLAP